VLPFLYLYFDYRDGVNIPSRPHGYVPQDYVEALKWLNIAIARKEVKACNMFYDFYHGVRNPADVNSDPLKEFYETLVSKMSAAQIDEAQKLAREWKPDNALDDRRGIEMR
jgi:TPR repeat protein